MRSDDRFSGLARKASRCLTKGTSVALLVAAIGVLVCSMFVGCSGTTTSDAGATQRLHASATLTAGAGATQAARAAASQTAAAIPLIALPYRAAAPGPGCDSSGATWTAQTPPQGASCLANPARLRVTAGTAPSGDCCTSEVDWTFEQTGKLPDNYRVSVEVSNIAQGNAGLVLNLLNTSGRTTSFSVGFAVISGTSAQYGAYLDGHETGFVSFTLTTPTILTIEVKNSVASCKINGDTKLQNNDVVPYTVTGVSLQMGGTSGDHADFANFSVEQP